ncbi:hypothetical protein, partial [Methylomonas fluvii]
GESSLTLVSGSIPAGCVVLRRDGELDVRLVAADFTGKACRSIAL